MPKRKRPLLPVLPDDLLALIFSWLPMEQVLKSLQLVCKEWKQVLQIPAAWNMTLKRLHTQKGIYRLVPQFSVSHLTSSYGCRRSEYKMWGLETLESWKGSLSPYSDGQEQNNHLKWQSCSFPLLKRVEFAEAGIWDLTSLFHNAPGLEKVKIDCLIPCHASTSPLLFNRTKLRSLTLGCSRNIPPAFWVALLSACPDLESLHLFKVAARYPSRMGDHVTREQVDDIYHRINMSPDCLTGLKNLSSLRLTSVHFPPLGPRMDTLVSVIPQLKVLELSIFRRAAATIPGLIAACRNLEVLCMDFPSDHCYDLRHLTHLRYLQTKSCNLQLPVQLKALRCTALAKSAVVLDRQLAHYCPNLQQLDLGKTEEYGEKPWSTTLFLNLTSLHIRQGIYRCNYASLRKRYEGRLRHLKKLKNIPLSIEQFL